MQEKDGKKREKDKTDKRGAECVKWEEKKRRIENVSLLLFQHMG